MSNSNKKTKPSAVKRAVKRGASYVCNAGCGTKLAAPGVCATCKVQAEARRKARLR